VFGKSTPNLFFEHARSNKNKNNEVHLFGPSLAHTQNPNIFRTRQSCGSLVAHSHKHTSCLVNGSSEHGGDGAHGVAVLFFAEPLDESSPSRCLQHLRLLRPSSRPSGARHRNATRLHSPRRNRRCPQFLRRSAQRVRRPGPAHSFAYIRFLHSLPLFFLFLICFYDFILWMMFTCRSPLFLFLEFT